MVDAETQWGVADQRQARGLINPRHEETDISTTVMQDLKYFTARLLDLVDSTILSDTDDADWDTFIQTIDNLDEQCRHIRIKILKESQLYATGRKEKLARRAYWLGIFRGVLRNLQNSKAVLQHCKDTVQPYNRISTIRIFSSHLTSSMETMEKLEELK